MYHEQDPKVFPRKWESPGIYICLLSSGCSLTWQLSASHSARSNTQILKEDIRREAESRSSEFKSDQVKSDSSRTEMKPYQRDTGGHVGKENFRKTEESKLKVEMIWTKPKKEREKEVQTPRGKRQGCAFVASCI